MIPFMNFNHRNFQHMFENLVAFFATTLFYQLFPDWMIRRFLPQKLISMLFPKLYFVYDVISDFYAFTIYKVKQHEDSLGL